MLLYRITKEKYLQDVSGQGKSFLDGARWNQPGLPVLYFASSPAVALLEMANYLPSPRLVPKTYRLGIYELPEDISIDVLTIENTPDDWAQYPYPMSTQRIGSQWLQQRESLCFSVPSAAIPAGLESIILVNPRHSAIAALTLIDIKTDLYNRRAFQGIS